MFARGRQYPCKMIRELLGDWCERWHFPISHHSGFVCLYGTHQEICVIGILKAAARARKTDLLETIGHDDGVV